MTGIDSDDECTKKIKSLLAHSSGRIELDDYVTTLLRAAINSINSDEFCKNPPNVDAESIQNRLLQYEQIFKKLHIAAVLLARWGGSDEISLLKKILLRLAEINKPVSGLVVWAHMRWYPIFSVIYVSGMSALSANNYPVLSAIFQTSILNPMRHSLREKIIVRASAEMAELKGVFNAIPGLERKTVPISEYMFTKIHPTIEGLLFLGESFESYFDEFEIIFALVYADMTADERGRIWGPVGRFGYRHDSTKSVFKKLLSDSEKLCEGQRLLDAGMFGASPDRFKKICAAYVAYLQELHLH